MTQHRRDIDESIERARSRRGRSGGFLGRMFSISVGDVVLLVVACVVVGFLLAMFGVDPRDFWADLFASLGRAFEDFSENFGVVLRYLAYGAILVVPVWLLLRLFRAMR